MEVPGARWGRHPLRPRRLAFFWEGRPGFGGLNFRTMFGTRVLKGLQMSDSRRVADGFEDRLGRVPAYSFPSAGVFLSTASLRRGSPTGRSSAGACSGGLSPQPPQALLPRSHPPSRSRLGKETRGPAGWRIPRGSRRQSPRGRRPRWACRPRTRGTRRGCRCAPGTRAAPPRDGRAQSSCGQGYRRWRSPWSGGSAALRTRWRCSGRRC